MKAILLWGLLLMCSPLLAIDAWERHFMQDENGNKPDIELIAVQAQHEVWLAGSDTDIGLFLWDNGSTTSFFTGDDDLPWGDITSMVYFEEELWLTISGTVVRYDGSSFSTTQNAGNKLVLGGDDKLWLVNDDEIRKWNGSNFELIHTHSEPVYELLATTDGTLWFTESLFIAGSYRILRFLDGNLDSYTANQVHANLSSILRPKLIQLKEGILLTSETGDAYLFGEGGWELIAINNDGNGAANITSATSDGNQDAWFLLQNQSQVWDGAIIQYYDGEDQLNNIDLLSGTVWLNDIVAYDGYIYIAGENGTLLIGNEQATDIRNTATLDVNDFSARLSANSSHLMHENYQYKPAFMLRQEDTVGVLGYLTAMVGAKRSDNSITASGGSYITDYVPGNVAEHNIVYRSPIIKVDRTEIEAHKVGFSNENYQMPAGIRNWPANGFESINEPLDLAPFVDENSNGYYDPENGDYPAIRGDQAVYFIAGDKASSHYATGGEATGIELHGMVYGYNSTSVDALQQAVFFRYTLVNRNSYDVDSVRLGFYTYLELGNPIDNYVGSSGSEDVFYAYNSDNFDDDFSGMSGFGNNPPAIGFKALNTEFFGVQFPNSSNAPTGAVMSSDMDIWNYLLTRWKDGTPLSQGGSGYDPSNPNSVRTHFMYNGDPVAGTGWTELNAGNAAGGRGSIASFPSISLDAGERAHFDFVLGVGRASNGDHLTNISALFENLDELKNYFDTEDFEDGVVATERAPNSVQELAASDPIQIFPNPGAGAFYLTGLDQSAKILIKDLKGKSIPSDFNGSVLTLGDHVLNGVYMVQIIHSDASVQTKKIVLLR